MKKTPYAAAKSPPAKRYLRACMTAVLVALVAAPAGASSLRIPGDEHPFGVEFAARQKTLEALGDRPGKRTSLRDRIVLSGFERANDCTLDSDGDGLPDCVETNTGVYLGPHDTGTDPHNPDTDGDGISDGDEVLGTVDGLDLPALGVNPLRRDLLIEYDWFDDSHDCGAHSHAPTAAVLARVAAVFAAAPILNPDGSHGINVIQDAGQGGHLTGGNRIEGYSAILPGSLDATFTAIKQANFAPERAGYFRYVLMPHRYNGGSNSSGFAQVIGDNAIVSLQCAGTANNVTRTILHEIGHNLGLLHGGFEACNNKPNYNSVLNYRYQFRGLDDQCRGIGDNRSEGYSSGTRAPIDQQSINEFEGMCGFPAIDWNGDGVLQNSLSHDVNPGQSASCGGQSLGVLRDFDDWAHITLLGIRRGSALLKSIQHEVACEGVPPPA